MSQTCPLNPIGMADGVPEVVVGGDGVDLETPDLGRAYVFESRISMSSSCSPRRRPMDPFPRLERYPGGARVATVLVVRAHRLSAASVPYLAAEP